VREREDPLPDGTVHIIEVVEEIIRQINPPE
jgi:hypothetical protein